MEVSEILNVVLGSGLAGAIISIVTIRSALKKARGEAEKALAESDTVKITNTEQATRILVENIVKPLTEELNETRKEIGSVKREVARLRKAIDGANGCRYNADCPVLERLRNTAKDHATEWRGTEHGGNGGRGAGSRAHGQRGSHGGGQRKRGGGSEDGGGECAEVVGDAEDSDGQPP